MIEKRTKPKRGAKAFRIDAARRNPQRASNRFSVIEVEGLDRPGLLSEITGALSDLSLDIASAHITTFGEKVIDTFYVTDLTGQKIDSPTRVATSVRATAARRRTGTALRPSAPGRRRRPNGSHVCPHARCSARSEIAPLSSDEPRQEIRDGRVGATLMSRASRLQPAKC